MNSPQGESRRRFLERIAAACALAGGSAVASDADAARPRSAKRGANAGRGASPGRGAGGGKSVPKPDAYGLPERQPYGHVNRKANLPPWDGATSSDSPPGQMRMFRGNRRHDYQGSGKLGTDLKVLWKFRMSDYATLKHGQPTVWQGTGWTGQTLKVGAYVFIGSTGGHLHCFEAATGALVWVLAADRCFKGSPCFYRNRIYIPNVDNHLRCVDAATGALLWKWRSPNDMDSSPLVVDGVLYVGGEDGAVKAFDPESGRLLWRVPFGVGEGEKPGSGGIESSLAIDDGVAYFGHLDGNVRALDLKTRTLRWQTAIGGDTDASPLLAGDRLYIGCQCPPTSFHCLSRATGEVLWTKDIAGGVWSTAAAAAGMVIVGGHDGGMHALDAATGEGRWVARAGAAIWSSPAIVDGKVIFGSYDPYLRMVDLKTGSQLWRADLGGRSHSAPAIEDGKIWVGSASGWYYCFG